MSDTEARLSADPVPDSARCGVRYAKHASSRQTCPMPRRKILRDQLYRAAPDLGNLEAVEMRPDAFAKRVAHERVYRATNQWTRCFPRGFGR